MAIFFGYIEPASTALLGQIIAGILITLGVVFGIWWRKITTFFRSIFAKLFGKKQDIDKKEELAQEVMDDEQEELESTTDPSTEADAKDITKE